MKTILTTRRSLSLWLWLGLASVAAGQPADEISYQGRLAENGAPAAGLYDFEFTLVNPGLGQASPVVTLDDVLVTDGVFTVALPFEAVDSYIGAFVRIAVRPGASVGAHTLLSPDQPLHPVPRALKADIANSVSGVLTLGNLPASVPLLDVPATFTRQMTFAGDGGAPFAVTASDKVANLNSDQLDGLDSSAFWQLGGNVGTVPGMHFVGTSDSQPLHLGMNGETTLRLEAGRNIIGGHPDNTALNAATAVTISGGGSASFVNSVGGIAATIGGGWDNQIAHASWGTIAGGNGNRIEDFANFSTVAGGNGNRVETGVSQAFIGGGTGNQIETSLSSVSGGFQNIIEARSSSSSIGGGSHNSIAADARNGVIGGGSGNNIRGFATFSVIGGGQSNRVDMASELAVIAGGDANQIEANASWALIVGGRTNLIGANADHAVLAGGRGNRIEAQAEEAFIGGGRFNEIGTDSVGSAVVGGTANEIGTMTVNGVIAGGGNNRIGDNAERATIGGGFGNQILDGAGLSVIPGGYNAEARTYGQHAFASGFFSAGPPFFGVAQTSTFVLRRTTTDNTPTELHPDGDDALHRMTLAENSTWTFDILVVGRRADGASSGCKVVGVIENDGGATSLVGSPIVSQVGAGPCGAAVEADDVNDALIVMVSGFNNADIRWVAVVRTAEVIH